LPPLELFSLKKKPPCCRVASSRFRIQLLGDGEQKKIPQSERAQEIFFCARKQVGVLPMHRAEESTRCSEERRHSMSHTMHPALQVTIALLFLAIVILPNHFTNDADFDVDDRDRNHIP
jgi:hypothetical protein